MKLSQGVQVLSCLLFLYNCAGSRVQDTHVLADAHIHFNWNQKEIISAQEVVDLLKKNRIHLAFVSSTPPELAVELATLGSDWIIPFFRPYYTSNHRSNWFMQESILSKTEEALKSGLYYGIGEIHLIGGVISKKRNAILDSMFLLARTYRVPVIIHTEASRADFFLPICRRFDDVRILWAHAGGILKPRQITKVMDSCSNVWVDLSARDNDRYINSPIVDKLGSLRQEWKDFVIKYQDRVLFGTDPVWPVDQLESWDSPGLGWSQYERFLSFHRRWLNKLPEGVAKKIEWRNARKFLEMKPDVNHRTDDY